MPHRAGWSCGEGQVAQRCVLEHQVGAASAGGTQDPEERKERASDRRSLAAPARRPYAGRPPPARDGSRLLVLGRPALPLATMVRGPRAREARDGRPLGIAPASASTGTGSRAAAAGAELAPPPSFARWSETGDREPHLCEASEYVDTGRYRRRHASTDGGFDSEADELPHITSTPSRVSSRPGSAPSSSIDATR